MSATINEDSTKSVSNQDGQFGSHVARTGPQETTGHQPGKLVGNDKIPEFNAETLPAGTAPASRTFKPNNMTDIPAQDIENYAAQQDEAGATTSASDTLGGATSAEVHTGLGHPGSGMSSKELRHDGGSTTRGGLQGVGASGAPSHTDQKQSKLDTESPIPGKSQKRAGGEDHSKTESVFADQK